MEAPQQGGYPFALLLYRNGYRASVKGELDVPYLQTPAPARVPRINSAPVYGVSPGAPVISKVAATGTAPLHYTRIGAAGRVNDRQRNGVITGVVKTGRQLSYWRYR